MIKKLAAKAAKEAPADPCWSVYIVRCGDDSFYTGIAKDVDARLKKHNSGQGAAYTRSRRPVALLYRQDGFTRSEALVREAQIKALPRSDKAKLALTPRS
jgi:predicted GIY-YIG superfamily endonuclease